MSVSANRLEYNTGRFTGKKGKEIILTYNNSKHDGVADKRLGHKKADNNIPINKNNKIISIP